ncbi:MAG: SagB/ThcOx family dehydrogenase, partial [Caldilineae bacterium]|nr:SagB/ThcOx family dehydrogenase [Caldilineae bacterium]
MPFRLMQKYRSPEPQAPLRPAQSPLDIVLDYHQATKHAPYRYARSLGYMDWDTQPDPFRRYRGAPLLPLDEIPPTADPPYGALFQPGSIAPRPLDRDFISQLFYDSLALSAWKEYGGSRWALRVNPSSGNLHPTEGYLISGPVAGLLDSPAVCHYAPDEHGLEVRRTLTSGQWQRLLDQLPHSTVLVALTSIVWREAWKYGERAFRYCMHDVGHALAAVAIAAAAMGWQARLLETVSEADL